MTKFNTIALFKSLLLWNNKITEYALNNYDDFNYLEKSDVKLEEIKYLSKIIQSTICSLNFAFYESILLQFFKNNMKYIENNIYDILDIILNEKAYYFFREFLKYPTININYKERNNTFFFKSSFYIKILSLLKFC